LFKSLKSSLISLQSLAIDSVTMDITSLHELKRKTQTSEDALTNYIMTKFVASKMEPAQEKLVTETMKHRKHRMLGSQDELHFLAMLCKLIKAKKTLDIGVFTGYSALTIALALPADGKVVACDVTDEYLTAGKPLWEEAGVSDKIDLHIAPSRHAQLFGGEGSGNL